MDYFLQNLITGISLGSIYGLVGLGFTLVFSISKVVNLAQGQFFTIGAMSFIVLNSSMPMGIALVLAVIIAAGLGILIERGLMNQIEKSPLINKIIMTLAVLIFLQGLSMLIFGKQSMTAAPVIVGSVQWGAAHIQYQIFIIIGVVLLTSAILSYFLQHTMYGKAFRACSSNVDSVRLAGVQVSRMKMLAYGISGAIGAIAGIIIAPLLLVNYSLGLIIVIKGLIASILGGLGSARGALLGGVILGLFESFSTVIFSSEYKDVLVFTFLLAILIVMPKGLVGGFSR